MLFQEVKEQIFKLPQGDHLALVSAIIPIDFDEAKDVENNRPINLES